MGKSLDELIDFLLEEIALSGKQGATLVELASFVQNFYNETNRADAENNVETGTTTAPINQNFDHPFLERVWKWLSRHSDISIGKDKQYNNLSLRDVETRWPIEAQGVQRSDHGDLQQPLNTAQSSSVNDGNKEPENGSHSFVPLNQASASTTSSAVPPRIFVTEARMYEALCGHPWDPRKISPHEFVLLSWIAVTRGEGMLQGDLVRASGQDKRSVPKRTDRMSRSGYIVKTTVYVKGTKTSRLTLRKFSTEQSRQGPDKKKSRNPKPQRTVGSIVTQLFDLLAQTSLISQKQLEEKLDLKDNGSDRVLMKILKRLAALGHVKRVKTSLMPSASKQDMEHFVQLVSRPPGDHMCLINTEGLLLNSTIDEVASSLESAASPNAEDPESTVAGQSSLIESSSPRILPCWNPDRLLANTCQQVVLSSQRDGLDHVTARSLISGPFVRRPLESLFTRLSHRALLAQPSYLRHLAIVRTPRRVDGIFQYSYYPAPALRSLVDGKQLDVKSVQGLRAFLKDSSEEHPDTNASTSRLDEAGDEDTSFGFVGRSKPSHQVQLGEASLADIIKSLAVLDKKVKSGEPIIIESLESGPELGVAIAVADDDPEDDNDAAAADNDDDEEEEVQERGSTSDVTPARTPSPIRQTTPAEPDVPQTRRRKRPSVNDDVSYGGSPKKAQGRPRKFLRGTEKFWQRQFLEARQRAEPNATPEASQSGVMSDPLGQAIFMARPKDFDEVLLRALAAGLPIPSAPDNINQAWVDSMTTILNREKPGLYISLVGNSSLRLRRHGQIMILRSSRLHEVDFTDRNVVSRVCFIPSMAAHTRHYKPYYPKLSGASTAETEQLAQPTVKKKKEKKTSRPSVMPEAIVEQAQQEDIPLEENEHPKQVMTGKESIPPWQAIIGQQQGGALVTNTTDDVQVDDIAPPTKKRKTLSHTNASRKYGRASGSRKATARLAKANSSSKSEGQPLEEGNAALMIETATLAQQTPLAQEADQIDSAQQILPDAMTTTPIQGTHSGVTRATPLESSTLDASEDDCASQRVNTEMQSPAPVFSEVQDNETAPQDFNEQPHVEDNKAEPVLTLQEADAASSALLQSTVVQQPEMETSFDRTDNDTPLVSPDVAERSGELVETAPPAGTISATPTPCAPAINRVQHADMPTESMPLAEPRQRLSANKQSLIVILRPPSQSLIQIKTTPTVFAASRDPDESYHSDEEVAKPTKQRKTGTNYESPYNREVGKLLQRIIIDLVEACDGVLPSLATVLRRGMMNRWSSAGQEGRPATKRIRGAIKALCDKGRLRQHYFAFRGKSGLMIKESAISLPSIAGSDELVTDLKLKIQQAEPTEYTPPKLEQESNRAGHIPIRPPSPSRRPGRKPKAPPSTARDHAPPEPRTDVTPGGGAREEEPGEEVFPDTIPDSSFNDAEQSEDNISAFITLKVPRLGTLNFVPRTPDFRATCQPPVVLKFNTDATLGLGPVATQTPLEYRKTGYGPKRGERHIPLREKGPLRRTIEWKQSGRKNVLPDSLQAILKARPGFLDTQRPLLGITAQKQFELEVDEVEAWERRATDLFEQPKKDWIFINHAPEILDNEAVQPKLVTFEALVGFTAEHEILYKPVPIAESWDIFAQALRVSRSTLLSQDSGPTSLASELTALDAAIPETTTTRSGRKIKKRTFNDAQLDVNIDPAPKRTRRGQDKRKINIPLSERTYAISDTGVLLDTSKPDRPKPVKAPRGPQLLRNVPEQDVYRLAVILVVIRTLSGGVDKVVDLKLLKKFYPDQDEALLQQKCRVLLNTYLSEVTMLTESLQDRYIDALENDEVPVVNFHDLQQTDWDGIVKWALVNLDKFDTRDIIPLPKTKSALLNTVEITFGEQGKQLRDLQNYNALSSTQRLEEATSGTVFGTEVSRKKATPQPDFENVLQDNLLPPEAEEEDNNFAKARSWALATVLTPRERFDAVACQEKLLGLASTPQECEELLDRALKTLQRDKIICRSDLRSSTFSIDTERSRPPGPAPKGWEPTTKYYENFEWRRMITCGMLRKAAKYKVEVLDAMFQSGTEVAIGKDTVMDDGEMVCLTNLLSTGAVKISIGHDVPKSKYGLDWQNSGYQTRLMDKSMLGFTVLVDLVKDAYTFGHLGSRGKSHMPIPRGDMDCDGKFPSWFDIHGHFQQELWESMLSAVIGLIDMRPGVGAVELSRCLHSALTKWEIELMITWMTKGGFIRRSGYGVHDDVFDDSYEGYETTETWWLVLGAGEQWIL